jgi:hypothetical protein
MWESPFFGDFQGLWEEGETGWFHRPVFHAFHQTGISTAFSPPANLRRENTPCEDFTALLLSRDQLFFEVFRQPVSVIAT